MEMDKLEIPEIKNKDQNDKNFSPLGLIAVAKNVFQDDYHIEKRFSSSQNGEEHELVEMGTAMAYFASGVVAGNRSKKKNEDVSIEMILSDSDEESQPQ